MNLNASSQDIFERYELKYMLTQKQCELLLKEAGGRLVPDRFSHSEIRNIYYDTPGYTLIRRSLEHPVYKEKLRVRSYQKAAPDDPVYVELKKKYDSVVYKRRLSLPQQEATAWLEGLSGQPLRFVPEDIDAKAVRERGSCGTGISRAYVPDSPGKDALSRQIGNEISYFVRHYPSLRPAVFLSYDRDAYREAGEGDLRVTFDSDILFRQEALTLSSSCFGTPILPEDTVLMEVKTSGALPLWLVHFLTGQGIHKTTFSKYGAAYERILEKEKKGVRRYA